jgi:hypothetical protein
MTTQMIYITCVYEDEPTYQIMLKMFSYFPESFAVEAKIPCYGYGKIKTKISAYNHSARHRYWFVITDLDQAECAPSLVREWLPEGCNGKMLFRVAVREIESWLLADKKNFSTFFTVNPASVPAVPDSLNDPKQTIFTIVKQSGERHIQKAILPVDTKAHIGPGYNEYFIEFIQNYWNIDAARQHSVSLDKTLQSLGRIAYNVNDGVQ